MNLPLKAPSGRSHHATIRQLPDLPIQAVSCSALDAGLDLLLERPPDLVDQLRRRDEIPELRTDRLLVGVAGQLAEGVVDALDRDRPVPLDGDQQARRRAGDDGEEVALGHQLLALADQLRQVLAADQAADACPRRRRRAEPSRRSRAAGRRRPATRSALDLGLARVHARAVLLRRSDARPPGGTPPTRAFRARVSSSAIPNSSSAVSLKRTIRPSMSSEQEDDGRDVDDVPRELLLALQRPRACTTAPSSRRVRSVKSRTITTTSSSPDGTNRPSKSRSSPSIVSRYSTVCTPRDGRRRPAPARIATATSGGRISRTLLPTMLLGAGGPATRGGPSPRGTSRPGRSGTSGPGWRRAARGCAPRCAEAPGGRGPSRSRAAPPRRPRRAGRAGAGARRRGRARRAGGRPTRGRCEWSPGETCRAAAATGLPRAST